MIRWCRGDRESQIRLPDPDGGPDLGDVDLTDRVTRAMWGVELGARWKFTDAIHLEGGWRHRDWHPEDGPGSFSGPYLRLAAGF